MSYVSTKGVAFAFHGLDGPPGTHSASSDEEPLEQTLRGGSDPVGDGAATRTTARDARIIQRSEIGPMLTRAAVEEQLINPPRGVNDTDGRVPRFALVESYDGPQGWITGQFRGQNIHEDVEHLIDHLKLSMPEDVDELYVRVMHVDEKTGVRSPVTIKLSRDTFGRIFVDQKEVGDPRRPT